VRPAPDAVRRQLEFLINGFDFYGHKERLRDDDRLVRERAASSLVDAAAAVRRAEQEARRRLPPSTREQPFPPPDRMAIVRDLSELGRAVGDLEGRLRALPYPHADRTWARLRTEAVVLELLLEHDLALVAAADAVRAAAEAMGAEATAMSLAATRNALVRCEHAVRERWAALEPMTS
jgi:hypothetical protein